MCERELEIIDVHWHVERVRTLDACEQIFCSSDTLSPSSQALRKGSPAFLFEVLESSPIIASTIIGTDAVVACREHV